MSLCFVSILISNTFLTTTSLCNHVLIYGTILICSVWWQLRLQTHVSEEMKMFSTYWCQDLSSVNNMISRDEILNEVNIILQTLHSIVNKLSVSTSNQSLNVSQENLPEFHHEEFWLDDDLVNVSMSVS